MKKLSEWLYKKNRDIIIKDIKASIKVKEESELPKLESVIQKVINAL